MSGTSKELAGEELRKNLGRMLAVTLIYMAIFFGIGALSFSSVYILKSIPKLVFAFIANLFLVFPLSFGWIYVLYTKKYKVKSLFEFFKSEYYFKVILLSSIFMTVPNFMTNVIRNIKPNSAVVFLLGLLLLFVVKYVDVLKYVFIINPEGSIKKKISYAFRIYVKNFGELIYFELSFLGWVLLVIVMTILLMLSRQGFLQHFVLVVLICLVVFTCLYYYISKVNFCSILIQKYEATDTDDENKIDIII